MSVVADAMARDAREIERSPDVFFVRPGDRDMIYAVQLPQDTGRFVLVDDADGYDVMFKYRGRWYPLTCCWRQAKRVDADPCENHWCSLTVFGRKYLRKHKVKEMTWKEWKEDRGTSRTTPKSAR